jgi:hypothetical protein
MLVESRCGGTGMNLRFKVTGIEALSKRLDVAPAIRSAIQAATLYYKGKIAIYPPATAANRPGRVDANGRPMGYYIRGTGYFNAAGAQTSYSETLGKKWTTTTKNGGYTGIVGNNASYAAYVQDEESQAPVHKRTGWGTVQGVARAEMEKLKAIIKNIIVTALNKR